VTFTKSIDVSFELTSPSAPIVESLINPLQANSEEILNRAKQIYLDEVAKNAEPIIEPELEELEESGALDQAKEELNQELEQGTVNTPETEPEPEPAESNETETPKIEPEPQHEAEEETPSKTAPEIIEETKSGQDPAESPELILVKSQADCSRCNLYKTQKGLYHHLINKHGFDAKTAYDKANEILEAKPASEEVSEEKRDQAPEPEKAQPIVEPIIQKTPTEPAKELVVVVEATPYAQSFILDQEPIEEESTKELVVIVEPNPQSFIMDQEPAEETLDETPIPYQVSAILTRATETLHWLVSNLRL
jgi:hypothetical protein